MDAHANFAVTTVSVAPSPASSGTSLTVTDASVYPAAPFNATICDSTSIPTPATAEIVRVTNIAGNVLTITRTQEATSARTVLVGDVIACTITKKVITDIESGYIGTGTSASNVTWTVGSGGIALDARGYAGTVTGATNASVTANSNGVSVSVGNYLTTAMASNRGSDFVQAAAAFAGTNASGTIASNGISVSVAAPSGANTVSRWANAVGANVNGYAFAAANSNVYVVKMELYNPCAFSMVRIAVSSSHATAANNSSAYLDYSYSAVLYSRNGSTLSSMLSGSQTGTVSWSSNALVTGGAHLTLPFASATTLAAGEYWMAHYLSTANTATGGAATTSLNVSLSMYAPGGGQSAIHNIKPFGGATNQTYGIVLGQGVISTGVTVATIPFTSISNSGSRGLAGGIYMEALNYTI